MTRQRGDLGFGAELNNLGSFGRGKAAAPKPKTDSAQTQMAAEAAGFSSREPQREKSAPEKPIRRRRTGRNAQFNIKAKPETIEEYCRIADENGWGLGETLERAVELLRQRVGATIDGEDRAPSRKKDVE